jgi:uncharacterized protein (UPF0147 family)
MPAGCANLSTPMTQRSGANSEKDAGTSASPSPSSRPSSSATSLATELTSGTSPVSVEQYIEHLSDPRDVTALQAARVIEELATLKPELLAPHIETLVTLLGAARPRIAQSAAHSLPVLARVAPAKVAKQLKTMQAAFPGASELAKDGLVRTFVALCVASVTYQKRLIENFELALRTADPKQLPSWVEHILPALKGEPYAQARSVVEHRVNDAALPRNIAQQVADILGVKLRALPEKK